MTTGKMGEDLAARFLENLGYRVLQRNFHTREGEVDIIARDANELVFVEVKTGRQSAFGDPETWVDERKQQRLGLAAQAWLLQQQVEDTDCRFDVVAIFFHSKGHRIKHIKNAFWLE